MIESEYAGESARVYMVDGQSVTERTQLRHPGARVSIDSNVVGSPAVSAKFKFKEKYRITFNGTPPTGSIFLKLEGSTFFSPGCTAKISIPKVKTVAHSVPDLTGDIGISEFYMGIKKVALSSQSPSIDIEISGDGTASAITPGTSATSNGSAGISVLQKGLGVSKDPEHTFELGYSFQDLKTRVPVVNEYENSKRYTVGYSIIQYPTANGVKKAGIWSSAFMGSLLGYWAAETDVSWTPSGYSTFPLPSSYRLFEKVVSDSHLQTLRRSNSSDTMEIKVKADDSWVPGTGGVEKATAMVHLHPPTGLDTELDRKFENMEKSSEFSFEYNPSLVTWSLTGRVANIPSNHTYTVTEGFNVELSTPVYDFLKIGYSYDKQNNWGDQKTSPVELEGAVSGPIPVGKTVVAWVETTTTQNKHLRYYDQYGYDGYERSFLETTMYKETKKYVFKSRIANR